MKELKRGGEGRNNHRRHFSFYVLLLWRVGKTSYHESTPACMLVYKKNQENWHVMVNDQIHERSKKGQQVESTDGWYSSGAKNLFGSDGAQTEHLVPWLGIHIACGNTGTRTSRCPMCWGFVIHCDPLDLLSPALVGSLQQAAGWPPGLSPKAGEADGHLLGGRARFLKNEARFLGGPPVLFLY